MDFKTHLETAWKRTLQSIVPLIILTLAAAAASTLSLGILSPVIFAAYCHSILMLVRDGREPRVQDLFSRLGLFLPLLGFSVVVFIVLGIAFSMFVLPGLILSFAITWLSLYLFPMMTDRHMGLIDALKASVEIANGEDRMDHLIVAILFIGISSIGSSLLVGWLFTLPLATVFLMGVYEEKAGGMPLAARE